MIHVFKKDIITKRRDIHLNHYSIIKACILRARDHDIMNPKANACHIQGMKNHGDCTLLL